MAHHAEQVSPKMASGDKGNASGSALSLRNVPRPELLAALVLGHTILYVVVLIDASFQRPEYLFPFDPGLFWRALLIVSLFAVFAVSFVVSEFSFGYVLTYYFYLMIMGFLWVNQFTVLNYNHSLAGISAVVSVIAFALPALLIGRPVNLIPKLTPKAIRRIVFLLIGLCCVVVFVGLSHSFHLTDLKTYSYLRDELLIAAKIRSTIELPGIVRYGVGIMSSAILPLTFAYFIERKQRWLAALAIILLACFFPITFNKTSLFSPLWLIFVAAIATVFSPQVACVLTLLVPMTVGLISLHAAGSQLGDLFHLLDFRLMVIPSAAMSFYNDFFNGHERTFFCQIGPLKSILACPYQEQLGVVFAKAYGLGNYNASLFASEGLASVGPLLSPIPALVCGLLIGCVNRLSAGLPPRFILVSSAVVTFTFLNVPFSTTLVTYGAAILFLIWSLMPRDFIMTDKQ